MAGNVTRNGRVPADEVLQPNDSLQQDARGGDLGQRRPPEGGANGKSPASKTRKYLKGLKKAESPRVRCDWLRQMVGHRASSSAEADAQFRRRQRGPGSGRPRTPGLALCDSQHFKPGHTAASGILAMALWLCTQEASPAGGTHAVLEGAPGHAPGTLPGLAG